MKRELQQLLAKSGVSELEAAAADPRQAEDLARDLEERAARRYPALETLAAEPRRAEAMARCFRELAARLDSGSGDTDRTARAEAAAALRLAAQQLHALVAQGHEMQTGTSKQEERHE